MKKLYRSDNNKIWGGVIGGISEYFNVDPTVLRLAVVFLFLATAIFPGIIAYIIALIIVPKKPKKK